MFGMGLLCGVRECVFIFMIYLMFLLVRHCPRRGLGAPPAFCKRDEAVLAAKATATTAAAKAKAKATATTEATVTTAAA